MKPSWCFWRHLQPKKRAHSAPKRATQISKLLQFHPSNQANLVMLTSSTGYQLAPKNKSMDIPRWFAMCFMQVKHHETSTPKAIRFWNQQPVPNIKTTYSLGLTQNPHGSYWNRNQQIRTKCRHESLASCTSFVRAK